jgi:hypothetical protein
MQLGSLELNVLVSDRPVREYGHQNRTYVEGRRGSKFTLRLRNHSAQRVLAVPSIDGLSCLDGQPATALSKGYVVAAYGAVEIRGWKYSLRESGEFVFTDRAAKSFAAQTHGDQNCGVIAVKVFGEKPQPAPPAREEHHHHHYHHHDRSDEPWRPWRPWPYILYYGHTGAASTDFNPFEVQPWGPTVGACSSSASYGCSMSSLASNPTDADYSGRLRSVLDAIGLAEPVPAVPDFNLGVGCGQVKDDVVSETSFERGLEIATLEIYYSDTAALSAAGVELNKAAQISKPVPQAFNGFCRPPALTA